MLSREVDVSLRNLRREHQPIMFVAACFSQPLELFRPEHFSQCVGRIDGTIDHDMYDVDYF